VGAILTQAAAWGNVEKALTNLKGAGALSPQALRALPREELARLIRPSGYFNAKTAKLQALAQFMARYGDDLDRLFSLELTRLREELLGVHGIGEETADSVILYAAGKPIFVVDAYTRRILDRLGIQPDEASYEGYRRLFMAHLPADAALYNEFHAQFVQLGKEHCHKTPRCAGCPLLDVCPTGRQPEPLAPKEAGRLASPLASAAVDFLERPAG